MVYVEDNILQWNTKLAFIWEMELHSKPKKLQHKIIVQSYKYDYCTSHLQIKLTSMA